MSDNNIATWLAERPEIESIFAGITDLNGVMRGKRVPVEQVQKVAKGELRMPLSVVNVDVWGEDIENSALVFESGDADGLCEYTGRDLLVGQQHWPCSGCGTMTVHRLRVIRVEP